MFETTTTKIKRKWKFVEGHEKTIVYIGLGLVYIILLFLVFVIYNNFMDEQQLEMKFESEKSFNSIYIALSDSVPKAMKTMEEEKVSGLGIYSSSGQVYQYLGDAPKYLPLEKLSKSRQKGTDSTLGVYILDNENKEIEYLRLSRLNVVLETGALRVSNAGAIQTPSDFPEIIYIKFDGTKYFASLATIRIVAILSIILITGMMLLVLSIYQSNRRYRIALAKNESLANLGAAARTLTHEIKNPLSAMTIQSALLKKLLPTEFHSDLEVMDHEILRLTKLTNRVSEFLKNPTGNPKEIEIVSFISDIARLFPQQIPIESNVQTLYVNFDEDLARSVFENLIKNATESTQDRDPNVQVEVRRGRRHMVYIRVKDRGDGIPEDAKEKLFDPFFTTKIHGSGIGLAISRKFVQAAGGTLKLSDRDGGGTVAEVSIPFHERSEESK